MTADLRCVDLDQLDSYVIDVRTDRRLDVWCTSCGHFVVEERHALDGGIELHKLLVDVLDHRCGGS